MSCILWVTKLWVDIVPRLTPLPFTLKNWNSRFNQRPNYLPTWSNDKEVETFFTKDWTALFIFGSKCINLYQSVSNVIVQLVYKHIMYISYNSDTLWYRLIHFDLKMNCAGLNLIFSNYLNHIFLHILLTILTWLKPNLL